MSNCVIVNDEGLLYGGFQDGKPVWFKTKRDDCVIDCKVAEMAVKQLKALGFGKVVVRDAGGVIRKWVPSDLDASADLTKAA